MVGSRWVIASSGGADGFGLSLRQREGFIGYKSLDEIVKAVTDQAPDCLAVDAIMPGGDACELARRLSLTGIGTMPVMLVLAPEGMIGAAGEMLKGVNVRAIMRKPVTGDELSAAVETATVKDRLKRFGADKSVIARLLWKLGFTPAVRGFEYALSAIELVSRDIRVVKSMSRSLYPVVAAIYQTRASEVECAIRRAMDGAWSSGSPKIQYALFANTIDEYRAKPTLGQLFACIAERLYSGMEIDI